MLSVAAVPLRRSDPADARASPRSRPSPRRQGRPHPVVFATLHLALWESQTWLSSAQRDTPSPFGIIFRPLGQPGLNTFVRRTPRAPRNAPPFKEGGLCGGPGHPPGQGLRRRPLRPERGPEGSLTLLFGRVCSSTELPRDPGREVRGGTPDVLSRRRRLSNCPGDATIRPAVWFERAMGDEGLCASWLWAHDRWRDQDIPSARLRLGAKRRPDRRRHARARGLARMPRKTRFWVRLRSWLGDVAMAVAASARDPRIVPPDAEEITLLAQPGFVPLLESWGLADRVSGRCRGRAPGYSGHFAGLRTEYPDASGYSSRTPPEATWRRGSRSAPLGRLRPGRFRPLLSDTYRPPKGFDEAHHHQLELWELFLGISAWPPGPDSSPFPGKVGPPGADRDHIPAPRTTRPSAGPRDIGAG